MPIINQIVINPGLVLSGPATKNNLAADAKIPPRRLKLKWFTLSLLVIKAVIARYQQISDLCHSLDPLITKYVFKSQSVSHDKKATSNSDELFVADDHAY